MGTRHILGTTGFHGKKTSLKYSTMAAAWQKLADFFEAADLLVVLTHPGQVGEPHCILYYMCVSIWESFLTMNELVVYTAPLKIS
jgi:hypothetical protein